MRTYRQGANERTLYRASVDGRLEVGDYVTGVTWTADAGITTADSDFGDDYVEIEAEGGEVDTQYTFQAVLDTANGRKIESSFIVMVVDR